MSGHNAARSLPPGDRDEAPPSLGVSSDADLFAGREPQPGGADEQQVAPPLLPGLSIVIDECQPALDAAMMALGDLKLAQKQANVALFKAAAHRLASLINHVARVAKEYRPRDE